MADADQHDVTALTVQLLTAYVSNNTVPIDQLPGLIEQTLATLAKREEVTATPEVAEQDFTPAVSARKSLASPDYIVSMIDGKPYKTLRRHLSTHGLTPEDYRARYNLPATYPMVAPSYSEARRDTAKRLGLGRKPAVAAAAPASSDVASDTPEVDPAPKQRRRKTAKPDAG